MRLLPACVRTQCNVSVASRMPLGDEMRVPFSRCHPLTPSISGHLLRSDERVCDANTLFITLDETHTEAKVTRCVEAARSAAPMPLARYSADRERRLLEQPAPGIGFSKRVLRPLVSATAADLFKRARAVDRQASELWRLSTGVAFTFEDLQSVPFPPAVYDFVYRRLHRRLAFESYLKIKSGALMTDCPDCGLSLDLLSNDHVTVDCVSAVRNALECLRRLRRG